MVSPFFSPENPHGHIIGIYADCLYCSKFENVRRFENVRKTAFQRIIALPIILYFMLILNDTIEVKLYLHRNKIQK